MTGLCETKKVLANSIKNIMNKKAFSKITIGEVCVEIGFNRKSFYYHFKDKYDLMDWIYYTEFILPNNNKEYTTFWDFMQDLYNYLYENKSLYINLIKTNGLNCQTNLFREIIYPTINKGIEELLDDDKKTKFYIDFLTDAILYSIEKNLSLKNDMQPKKVVENLKNCIERG